LFIFKMLGTPRACKEWKTINDKETPALGAKLQLAAKQ
jgi:hypothetical protein